MISPIGRKFKIGVFQRGSKAVSKTEWRWNCLSSKMEKKRQST